MDRWIFYEKMFLKNISKNSNILLISGSEKEIKILRKLGYTNFKITYHKEFNKNIENNYDLLVGKNLFDSDVRNLKFNDSEYDYVITNATLHHIDVPHIGISEMYRVAKKGVLVIEGNDSLIMRLACKIKFSEEFEVSSVKKDKEKGGLLDTGIPNYVYRWTEREVNKLVKSIDPTNKNTIIFDYENDLNNIKSRNRLTKTIIFFAKIFFVFFKKQQNCLSIFIDKTKSKKRF
ncbi:methyltransferase domain-containing protein [Pelagibacterales bacterium SAG-MED22]|nr:methyltransferase domain-containing protein [Pelagibacterales bacterium SAG-MED22]